MKPYKLLQEWAKCPLEGRTMQLCQVGFMGDYRFKRKRCKSCLLVVGSRNWKRLEQLIEQLNERLVS
jgi:hypothetical protein